MKRVLLVVVCVAVVGSAILLVSCWGRTQPPPSDSSEPVVVHRSDLPKLVYLHGSHIGSEVRVAYPLRLHPTADPLVWEYRPGSPAVLPTHRIHFSDPPEFTGPLPVVVVGTVEGIDPDLRIRPNGVPGVVVLRAARPASP